MNQFAQFVARVQTIARTNQNEGTQKAEVEKLFGHFVLMSREAHSGERLESERVHNGVRGLHDYIVSEVNQHYADRHGALVEHAYDLVAHRMRKYIQAQSDVEICVRHIRSLGNHGVRSWSKKSTESHPSPFTTISEKSPRATIE